MVDSLLVSQDTLVCGGDTLTVLSTHEFIVDVGGEFIELLF